MLKEYALEPLIEAVTALEWSNDHAARAMEAIRAVVLENEGDDLSDMDALTLLGRLIERRFIRSTVDPPGGRFVQGRKGRYVRVPDIERLTRES